ncbi:alpha-1-antitrypsin homolog isoform X1 [Scomber scombrus]|uniref:alpha-1-antitrypsin homolog isoform X1 n=1 Tax=Scomber scombrus TaxID=13677 RepID=UPI002DDAEBA1|nr:alpha-1-antitrypsin homolog isoform X1 [Scomber scombrus]
MSMLSRGVCGETHSQLFSSLDYSIFNQTQVYEAYKHLFLMLGHSQESQQLDVGNGMALLLNVDFTKPIEAAAEIKLTHIADKTQGRIKDVVNDLDADVADQLFLL